LGIRLNLTLVATFASVERSFTSPLHSGQDLFTESNLLDRLLEGRLRDWPGMRATNAHVNNSFLPPARELAIIAAPLFS
jgi:hypothetical protein